LLSLPAPPCCCTTSAADSTPASSADCSIFAMNDAYADTTVGATVVVVVIATDDDQDDCSNAVRFSSSGTVRNSRRSWGRCSCCVSLTANGTGPSTDAMPTTGRLLELHAHPLQVARQRHVVILPVASAMERRTERQTKHAIQT
jgi:hypothetical protein